MPIINTTLGGFILLLFSVLANGSVVVQGTRVIFPDNKTIMGIQIINNSDQPSLVQSWIDDGDINSTPETTNAPFIVIPPITKIKANDGTQLRIQFIGKKLPDDRESIFYLNILDISPKPKNNVNGNFLQLALQTRLKLLYRPMGLTLTSDNALNEVKFFQSEQWLIAMNPTPYFVTLSKLYFEVQNNNPLLENIMIAPFSQIQVQHQDNISTSNELIAIYINDMGNHIRYKTTLKK
ncbi:molecular chaperone [Providencia burhodogranariea]|uniref:Pili assembly chaperone n=1 Tax=Providencia burhodogranariea DSM 19968 TaxID=1141662 RepID=K8WVF8_9GAMM|nr:pili assembly chaperone [Providencia burhodogranariea DSM 19968]